MIVEIPRWTNAKLEVRKDDKRCFVLYQRLNDIIGTYRSARKMLTTPSSKTPRRASLDLSATASPIRVTSGTMVLSPKYVLLTCMLYSALWPNFIYRLGKIPTNNILKPRPRVITIPSMSLRLVNKLATLVKLSKSRSLVLWLFWMKVKLTGRWLLLTSMILLLPSLMVCVERMICIWTCMTDCL